MMLGYNNYSTISTHHPHNNHYKRNRKQLDDTSNHYNSNSNNNSIGGGSSFHSTPTTTTPTPQHAFDDNSLRAAAASAIGINSQSLNQVPDLMPSDSWLVHSQHTPTAAQRLGHQRESSLSSLGSNGPASPYNPNISNPQIAVTDPSNDGFHELNSNDNAYSYQLGKQHMPEHFYASALSNYNAKNHHCNVNNNNGHAAMPTTAFADGLPNLSPSVAQQKPSGARGLAPAPELSASGGSSTRHAVSVASSTAGDDSPATPSLQEPEDDVRRPKNDRTLTDIYTDELYNPNFTFTSASPPQTVAMSPSNDVFAQRLHAANSQHLSAAQSPESNASRDRSPFRQCSPYASAANDFTQMGMNQVRLGSAQHLREKRKAEQDAREIQHQMARSSARQHDGTPNTISPKDAVLDFNEPDDGDHAVSFELFAGQFYGD
ncbi:putative 26s proteasome regulatory subunit-like protein [Eutypa lata UCREL1]|uniref:Putative 26s proteasome regulatory subunit-like protein n=1 Tax=Eutypa lata (strain UCR-EL1) TaxID=1287681 RepID=M7SBG5_EUTLA|nr:putative 26s proteasome regulatory subunit-like protein [Eutypa lata UCREL1]